MTDLHTAAPRTSPVRSRCGLDRAQIDALGDQLAESPSITVLHVCAFCVGNLPYPEHMRPRKDANMPLDRPTDLAGCNVGITPTGSWRDVDHNVGDTAGAASPVSVNVITARTTVARYAAVCELRLGTLDGDTMFTGSAKVNPSDRPNPDIGAALAFGRALIEAGQFYVDWANQESS